MVDMWVLRFTFLGALLPLSLCGAHQTPQSPTKECKTRWFNRDSPSGVGDYELLSYLRDADPDAICPEPIAIEVQTVDGVPAAKTGQTFFLNSATQGFVCINTQQGKGERCHDYQVRFTCPPSFCSPTPSPQAPISPKATLPLAQTTPPKPEETTSAESQKGGLTPRVPAGPETTLPPVQTRQPGLEETTIRKGAPTPQAQERPETTFPQSQTPQPEPERTTGQKGGPTPQAPVGPETTFPPAQTPHPEPLETTTQKQGPTPQGPVRPETTFPAARTPQPEPEQTTTEKGGPTPQVPVRPETTFPPARTPQPQLEETTTQEGGPTPQAPAGPETTFPPAQTPHPEPEETTTRKGVPTPQVPLGPETTFPPAQTPQPEPEETTAPKGAPTPQVPVGPETTFPPVRTPQPAPQEITCAEDQKGGPTPQPQVRPETTFPAAWTPRPEPEETTRAEGPKGVPTPQASVRPETTLPPVQTLQPGPELTTSADSQNGVCWTRWFDQDDPVGIGDLELLQDIVDNHPDEICSQPTGIEVQTLDGTPASETGQQFSVNDATHGFSCINTFQAKGQRCHDYRVRFTCPPSFCSGSKEQSTPDPRCITLPAPSVPVELAQSSTPTPVKAGQVQTMAPPEPVTSPAPTPTLEQVQSSSQTPGQGQVQTRKEPTIIVSTDSVPVQTTLKTPVPVCKTKWINRDNPKETGDIELLYYIRKNYPSAVCKRPIAIEVQTVDGIPAEQTGQQFYRNDVVHGFACVNAHQGKGVSCHDYKVRFTCTGTFCTGGDRKG